VERGEENVCYMGSADLMPRNLDHRVELLAPIEEPALSARVVELIEACLADTSAAWELESDGTWKRVRPPASGGFNAQAQLMELARRASQAAVARPPQKA